MKEQSGYCKESEQEQRDRTAGVEALHSMLASTTSGRAKQLVKQGLRDPNGVIAFGRVRERFGKTAGVAKSGSANTTRNQAANELRQPCLISNPSETGTGEIEIGRLERTWGRVTFFTEQTVTSPLLKKDQNLKERNPKVSQITSTYGPVQSTQKSSDMNLNPRPIQETGWPRKRGQINVNSDIGPTLLFLTPLIPKKEDRNPTYHDHDSMKLQHDGIPVVTSITQDTPSIHEQLRLMTPTQVSSSISLRITQPILKPNTTQLRVSGMTL